MTITLHKSGKGHTFTGTRDGKKCTLFVSEGNPVCLKSVMASLEHFL